jgi:hypothetical protein
MGAVPSFVPSLRFLPDMLSSQLSYVNWKGADFESAKTGDTLALAEPQARRGYGEEGGEPF